MSEKSNAPDETDVPDVHLYSLIIAQSGRLALAVAQPQHWHASAGYTFIPAELPGGVFADDTPLLQATDQTARHFIGQSVELVASNYLYGPSAIHAIDRLDAATEVPPLPLLRLSRKLPMERSSDNAHILSSVTVRAYLARPAHPVRPGPEAAGLLWLAPRALRQVMLGQSFADLLAQPGVMWDATEDIALPEDAFIYVPSDYGERHIVRIVAKYGRDALFQRDMSDGE